MSNINKLKKNTLMWSKIMDCSTLEIHKKCSMNKNDFTVLCCGFIAVGKDNLCFKEMIMSCSDSWLTSAEMWLLDGHIEML